MEANQNKGIKLKLLNEIGSTPAVITKFNDIINELDGNVDWDILSLGRNGEFSGYTGDTEKFWNLYKTDAARNSLKSKSNDVTLSTIDIPY